VTTGLARMLASAGPLVHHVGELEQRSSVPAQYRSCFNPREGSTERTLGQIDMANPRRAGLLARMSLFLATFTVRRMHQFGRRA